MTSTPEGGQSPWTQPSQQPDQSSYGTGAGWGPAQPAPGYGAPAPTPSPEAPTPYGPGAPASPPPPGWGAPPAPPSAPPVGYAAAPAALQPGIVPLRPLTVGELLDGAFRSVRANPTVMFGLTALVVTSAVVIQSVLQWYVQGLLAGYFVDSFRDIDPAGDELSGTFAASTASALTQAPILGISIAILTGLLIVSVSRSVIGQRVSASEVWAKVKPRALALVGFSLVYNLVVALAALVLAGLVVLLFLNEQYGLGLAAGLVGVLVYFVFAAWLAVRVLLVPPVLVLEGLSFRRAIARAWRLSRGSFWRLFGVLLLAGIIVGIVASIITAPGAFASLIIFPFADPTDLGPLVVNAVTLTIAQTISTVFIAAVVALQYIDVRMRREGLDVALARAAADAP